MKQTFSNQHFMTLNAQQFLKKYDIIQDNGGNNKIRYSFDYTNPYDRHYYISGTDTLEDCALLYQLSKVISGKSYNYDEDSVNTALVFVDFSMPFGKKTGLGSSVSSKNSYTKEELSPTSKTINNNYRLQTMFQEGFQIEYSKTNIITYVPFERSPGMAKKCKTSFIAKELYDEINSRLHLDIPFYRKKLVLSKFFAYKGLYLSSGNRVENKELKLNEETVVIINDIRFLIPDQSVITAERVGKTKKFKTKHVIETFEVDKAFDGEGILSPAYSGLINQALYEGKKEATSFQIRMPFTKGMLHQVDFKLFLSESADPNSDNGYYIKDVFGRDRDLNKAEIIMSVTMFKGFDWLKTHVKNLPENIDPMKYYFDKFREYEHALYITNTNLSFGRSGFTTLNYQFLNTLALTKGQMDTLASNHLAKAQDPIGQLMDRQEEKPPTWISVLKESPVFVHDTEIARKLTNASDGLKNKTAEGHFLVEGEMRFLSRDLLHFLVHLLYLMNEYKKNSVQETDIELIKNQNIYANRFYMPGNKIKLNKKKYCAIFRSPHLSRNEQCALLPFSASENNIYHKYFSHLSGVIMVGYKSLDPQALGGADFDGDTVNVISNKSVVNAVLSGAYIKKSDGKFYERKLPIISIPSASDNASTYGCHYSKSSYYKTVKNTFSNKIGQISNLALRLGQVEYSSPDIQLEHTCAECTIFTGLEIDAAKSGVHPSLGELIRYCKSLELEFEYKTNFLDAYQKHNEKNFFHQKFEPKLSHKISEDANSYVSPLALLPYYYREHIDTKWKTDIPIGKYFTFTKHKNWRSDLDNESLKKINAVIAAHKNVLSISRNTNNYIRKQKNSNYEKPIMEIIRLQYDTPKVDTFSNKTYWEIFQYLDNLFLSTDEVKKTIGNLRASNWAFLPKEQRRDALEQLLGTEKTSENDFFDYLLNFNSQGYDLILYFLHDVLSVKTELITIEKLSEHYRKKLSVNLSDIDMTEYQERFKEFYQLYLKEKSFVKPDKIWRESLEKTCTEKIKTLLNETDMEMRIKLLYATKANRALFWDYFSIEELSPYLYKQEENQC